MLYLRNISEIQTLLIPNSGLSTSGQMVLTLKSKADLTQFSEEVTDLADSPLYYTVAVSLREGFPVGEYEYRLMQDNDVLSVGLLYVVGSRTVVEYNSNIEYKQYGKPE